MAVFVDTITEPDCVLVVFMIDPEQHRFVELTAMCELVLCHKLDLVESASGQGRNVFKTPGAKLTPQCQIDLALWNRNYQSVIKRKAKTRAK